jgi:hypothetical protein
MAMSFPNGTAHVGSGKRLEQRSCRHKLAVKSLRQFSSLDL